MADCAARYGSGIERVLAEGIEVLISAEKLRGTDLCLGEIGALLQSADTHGFEGRYHTGIRV